MDINKINIGNIKVYNPKDDGLDAKRYNEIINSLSKLSPTACNVFEDNLENRVLDSKIEGNLTLRDFLLGEDGYLRKYPEMTVIFIDGKWKSTYLNKDIDSKTLNKLMEETNSIPFAFRYTHS
jgi:hypothetical protein